MDEKVVPLFGGKVPSRAEPNAEVIRTLQGLLTLAELGQLQGLSAAYTKADGTIETLLCTNGEHFAMSHALGALWWRFQQRMFDRSKGVVLPGDSDGP